MRGHDVRLWEVDGINKESESVNSWTLVLVWIVEFAFKHGTWLIFDLVVTESIVIEAIEGGRQYIS